MGHLQPTRRQIGTAALAAVSLPLAGCGDAGDGEDGANETDDETEADANGENGEDEPVLTVVLENEDGEPISENVFVTADAHDAPIEHGNGPEVIEDGEVVFDDLEEGEYTVTVESLNDEFEPVEEEFEMGDEDEELAFELEGASPDGSDADEESDDE